MNDKKINDGGQAFPHEPKEWSSYAGMFVIDQHQSGDGMTLRDYFAAKAMQAQVSVEGLEGCDTENVAGMAYEMADAMLEARKGNHQ